jgi:signal transduction histidine kinase
MALFSSPRKLGLRAELTRIVLGTVAGVLVLAHWLDTRLSETTLEEELVRRAEVVLAAVDWLWDEVSGESLAGDLREVILTHPDIRAIDVFRFRDGRAELFVSTREDLQGTEGTLPEAEAAELEAGRRFAETRVGADGSKLRRIAIPLRHLGHIAGAARIDFDTSRISRLRRRARAVDLGLLAASIASISLLLALFLERRVTRPVLALVETMRQAEAGDLTVRVPELAGEFGFLATTLNGLLAEIESLTSGLESRIREATRDLAEKNRELQAATERLAALQVELSRSERLAALGQMAATLAHELGTPLNSVLVSTQLLRQEGPPAAVAEKLEIIESQVRRMAETIRSVLDQTRDRVVRRSRVALRSLVSEVLEIVEPRAAAARVELVAEVADSAAPVEGDPVGLRQVLLNVVNNAVDAAGGGGRVRIRVEESSDEERGKCLDVTVMDSGPGMSAEELRQALRPFYTTKAHVGGTGLGLSIADHIVRQHGGRLWIDSGPASGTKVTVRLPAAA